MTWKKVYDIMDSGRWAATPHHCGGAVGAMPITWGGPIATFRWDNANDVDFKWLSVREICRVAIAALTLDEAPGAESMALRALKGGWSSRLLEVRGDGR